MKAFFSKIWSWILSHKIISIAAASVIVAGTTCAIVLPIALHQHSYAAEWSTDATSHWHVASCGHNDERAEFGAHEAASDYECDETNHWKNCATCGYDMSKEAHNYNKEVASSTYLKSAATETAKAVYYKSCVCGMAGTETFETDKTVTEITDVVMGGKTYDATAIAAPTFNKNSEGAATIEYKAKDADDAAYTATAPTDAGEYTVRISVAQTSTNTAASATKDFTISPIVIDNLSFEREYSGSKYFYVDINDYALDCHKENLLGIEFECESANVGASVTSALVSDDNDDYYAPNYVVGDNVTLTIVPRVLKDVTVTKAYDGTATIDNYRISWSDKDVYLDAELNSANVADANAATRIQLVGENAGNFSLSADEVTVSITKAQPTISDINVEPKTYDGNAINAPMYTVDTFVANADVVVEYKVKISDSTNYNGATKTADFTIEKYAIKDLTLYSVYNGTEYHTIDLSSIAQGLTLDVAFGSKYVGATVNSATVKLNSQETTNYEIVMEGDHACSLNIEPKELNVNWTPNAFVFLHDGTAKVPTAELEGVCSDDSVALTLTLGDGDSNTDVGSFEYIASINDTNYYLANSNAIFRIISPECSTNDNIPLGIPYFNINLAEGDYYIDSSMLSVVGPTGFELKFYYTSDLEKTTPVFTVNSLTNCSINITDTMETSFYVEISYAGYSGSFVIKEDDHTTNPTINEMGFCVNCNKYLGVVADTNNYVALKMNTGDKVYFRFDISGEITDPDLKLNIEFEDEVSVTYTAYDDNGDVIDLTTTATSFVATNSVYVVIEALENIDTMVQVEQTY